MFVTTDGVIQANGSPEGGRAEGFEYGGWQAPYTDDEVSELITGYTCEADAFLFGRRTYDMLAPFWSQVTADDPVAERFHSCPKYVVTSTPLSTEWSGAEAVTGDLATEMGRIKEKTPGEIQVHGSALLVRGLLEIGAVDRVRLWVHPLVIGTGGRLFDGISPVAMHVESVETTGTGVTVLTHRVVGSPEFRGFGSPEEYASDA